MSQTLCKLCLFKSEPMDEILIEDSECLKVIVDDIFKKMVLLTKLELDGICIPCREKLKSFHEYYKFVLENQKVYNERLKIIVDEPSAKRKPEFIEVIKSESADPDLEIKPLIEFEQKLEDEEDAIEEELKHVPGPGDYVPSPHSSNTESEAEEREREYKKKNIARRKRYQKPRSHILAIQKQQSDFVGLLFDFNCYICTKNTAAYKTLKKISTHYKVVHKKKKVWTCCGKEMSAETELVEHVIEHNGAPWKCRRCNEVFHTAIGLWKHGNEVHEPEPSKVPYEDPRTWMRPEYECECGMKFRTRIAISHHMKNTHIKNQEKCYICGASFNNKREVTKHREKEHADITKSPCPICGIMIKNSAYLMTAHIKNIHENQPMVCAICGRVCSSDRTYRSHMIRSHQPPKHNCSYCTKSFKSKTTLLDHEAVHSGICRWRCPVCGAQFKSLGNFSAHKRKLHPVEHQQMKMEREARKYQI